MSLAIGTPTSWNEPPSVQPRGTVLIFPGRAEGASTYWRLGPRLAADAYRVVVVGETDDPVALAAGAVAPVVALGSDTGAIAAIDSAASGRFDAVIVAAVPVGGDGDELVGSIDARTACSLHQAVLADAVAPGLAIAPVAPAAGESRVAAPAVPVLAIHGEADPISPIEEAVDAYRAWNATEIAVVAGGLHDILNDVSHRSVAATIIVFLERLRLSPELPAIVVEQLRVGVA